MFKISKSTLTKWLVLLAVVIIQLLTAILLNSTERFYIEKQQLLSDPEFVQGDAFWLQQGGGYAQYNGKSVSLVNEIKTKHFIAQTVPIEQSGHYTVNFEVATRDVVGAAPKYGAEVLVAYRDIHGAMTSYGKILFSANGTRPVAPYSRTLHLSDEFSSIDLVARLNNASGKITFSNVSISRLQELPLFKKLKVALVAIWLIVFVAFGFIAYRLFTRSHAIVLAGTLAIGLVGVLLPDALITSLTRIIESLLPTAMIATAANSVGGLFGFSSAGNGMEIGKVGHFGVFLMLGLLAGFNFRKIGLLFSLALLAVFASLTEVSQLLVVGRTTSFTDFLIDVSGGAIGVGVGVTIYLFFGTEQSEACSESQHIVKKPGLDCFSLFKNLRNSLKSLKP